jgi:3-deoxy-manno-octulosonate cytidylyltransferase (CMP-KDO synthetase)
MTQSLIVIPARYASTRLPGKPLIKIAGQTMLSRVYEVAKMAIENKKNVEIVIATDDTRIADHCRELRAPYVMTPASCPTGTDRALAAAEALGKIFDFVINLQGDAPLTPPGFITALLDAFESDSGLDVITPVTQLSWEQLGGLRKNKETTPFSGTTVILDKNDNAIWFSKNILPAIRKEEKYREENNLSPVFRHIGLYGYRYDKLKEYVTLLETLYEKLEGLEQLRALENGFKIRCVKVDYQGRPSMSGVDSLEDVARAEALLVNDHKSIAL